ncbi:hypothetical protein AAFF_G00218210 [Aldrovandia affinis]|uniref:Uncharacterized protein n=1 Tax=Aldrovandia affinis TaxID=143900 RepID=A0AAD7SX57_9TELE|nr:hypothetical protein AAFF_G00218210 [Aldrovandia affinis]
MQPGHSQPATVASGGHMTAVTATLSYNNPLWSEPTVGMHLMRWFPVRQGQDRSGGGGAALFITAAREYTGTGSIASVTAQTRRSAASAGADSAENGGLAHTERERRPLGWNCERFLFGTAPF